MGDFPINANAPLVEATGNTPFGAVQSLPTPACIWRIRRPRFQIAEVIANGFVASFALRIRHRFLLVCSLAD
jgi:hypothetical protein